MEGLEQVKKMFGEMEDTIKAKIGEVSQSSGERAEAIKRELETKLTEVQNQINVVKENIASQREADLPGVDPDKFSFARWAALNHFRDVENVKEFGYEKEVRDNMTKKDAIASDGSAGGFTVPTTLASVIVEPAIANMPLRSLGITVLNGVRGVLDIPGLDTIPASGHSSETGVPTKLNFVFNTRRMTPKRAAGYTWVSRRILRDSPLSVESYIRDKLITSLMLKMESGAINGTGANNEPTGILNYAGMSALESAITGQVTVKQLSQMKTDLDEVDFGDGNEAAMAGGSFGFLTRPIVAEGVRMARTAFYSGQTAGKGFQINNAPITNGAIEAYTGAKIAETSIVPKTGAGAAAVSSIVYGNWKHAIMALWSGLDVRASDVASDGTTHALPQGMVMIVADQDYDFCLDLPAAFVKATGVAAARSAWGEY